MGGTFLGVGFGIVVVVGGEVCSAGVAGSGSQGSAHFTSLQHLARYIRIFITFWSALKSGWIIVIWIMAVWIWGMGPCAI